MAEQSLRRELGLVGAVVIGLGSIIGTGAFVAIGLASARWGDAILYAIPIAAVVATFSGISSSFLAGRFPVAGGTYEFAYETLNPWLGFTAGWLFILAKTASAAAAALGVMVYLGVEGRLMPAAAVGAVTVLVLSGIRRTAAINLILVAVSIIGIIWFSVTGVGGPSVGVLTLAPGPGPLSALFGAVAFIFVAYTGYGRVATLGEEVKDPGRTIPRAVIVALVVTAILYMAIALSGRSLAGPHWGSFLFLTGFDPVVRIAAITAMLGVLLNLVLGLSRVWLAMGRRSDMPSPLARLDGRRQPRNAILLTAALVASVSLLGDIGLAWSFSAMTVLAYYAITNLAALALDRTRVTAWLGLVSCLFLSFFVPLPVWLAGAGLVAAGILWKTRANRTS